MDKWIPVEEAIKYLRMIPIPFISGNRDCDTEESQKYSIALNMSIKALEQTRWISVNERLPEEGLAVLTYGENGDYEVNWLDFDGKWFWEDVVAWMPLPKPYEPQERSGEE